MNRKLFEMYLSDMPPQEADKIRDLVDALTYHIADTVRWARHAGLYLVELEDVVMERLREKANDSYGEIPKEFRVADHGEPENV